MKNPLRSMKLWQKFCALGLLGTVMCAVPLVQLVHLKNVDIQVAQDEDAGIDPLRTAVALQLSLQTHRGLSSMVLNGNEIAGEGVCRREVHCDAYVGQRSAHAVDAE